VKKYLSRCTKTTDIDEIYYKYDLIFQLHCSTIPGTEITPRYLLETFHRHFNAGDMNPEEIERLKRETWV